jgi:DNA repair protein RAD51
MIPTGIKKLDQFLGGGIKNGIITDIFGASGTGKTQFAIQISINSLLQGGNVFYQDTTGDFKPERMHEIMKNRNVDISLMDKVKVGRITNTSEQIKFLQKIKPHFDLVVIDNISDLFSFEYSKDELSLEKNQLSLEKNQTFMKYMHSLSQIIIQNKISVIITNIIRNIDHVEIENLEKSISMFTHMKIRLAKNNGKYIANVYSPLEEIQFDYKISSDGLHDAS